MHDLLEMGEKINIEWWELFRNIHIYTKLTKNYLFWFLFEVD